MEVTRRHADINILFFQCYKKRFIRMGVRIGVLKLLKTFNETGTNRMRQFTTQIE